MAGRVVGLRHPQHPISPEATAPQALEAGVCREHVLAPCPQEEL